MSYLGLLTQAATYWAPESPDGVNVPAAPPVPIVCRWQDKIQRMSGGAVGSQLRVGDAGRDYISRAILYCSSELQKDGWVLRGTSTFADPVDAGAYRVKDTYRTQDPGNGIVVWKIFLG